MLSLLSIKYFLVESHLHISGRVSKKNTVSVSRRVSIVTNAASTASCDAASAPNPAFVTVGVTVTIPTTVVVWRHYVVVVWTQGWNLENNFTLDENISWYWESLAFIPANLSVELQSLNNPCFHNSNEVLRSSVSRHGCCSKNLYPSMRRT